MAIEGIAISFRARSVTGMGGGALMERERKREASRWRSGVEPVGALEEDPLKFGKWTSVSTIIITGDKRL
jgi:hypothetical protein